jgi:hypothetical protein
MGNYDNFSGIARATLFAISVSLGMAAHGRPATAQTSMPACQNAPPTPSEATTATMPMPNLKMGDPMPIKMAKDGTIKGDVARQAVMQAKCMDAVLTGEQSTIDKK